MKLPQSFPATRDNIDKGWSIVEAFSDQTSTNIYTALKVALRLVDLSQPYNTVNGLQPLIMFLTDGEPTEGITDTATIINDITALNTHNTPIYTLSFGDGADKGFLQTLSLKNKAFSRHIYESADASLQLEDFYRHISSPLLTNVKFKYTSATDVTKTEFPVLFGGSEIVVTGRADELPTPTVQAQGAGGLLGKFRKTKREPSSLQF